MSFPEELRPELLRFDHRLALRLRKHWRTKKGHVEKARHLRYCRWAGEKFGVHPRTVHLVLTDKRWFYEKPVEHLEKRQAKSLFNSDCSIESSRIVRGSTLYIPERKWQLLNKKFSRGKIVKAMIGAVRKLDLPPPYQEISQGQADEAFKRLCSLNTKTMFKREQMITRFEYKYPLGNLVLVSSSSTNAASNFFHQKNRWLCDHHQFPSPVTVWNNDDRLASILNSLWTMKHKKVTDSELRTSIALRAYMASQFKPSAAKAFYELFNAKRVYDPSSGWGDRLAGFMAASCTEFYCSTDPNSRLYEGYEQQQKRYGRGKEIKMYCHGSEVNGGIRKLYGHRVDTVFTSPPYFKAEQYSDDEGQSFKKHTSLKAWLNSFLLPTIDNSWDALTSEGERGGILGMNISDIFTTTKDGQGRICNAMNDHIVTLPKARYLGCIGLMLSRRPESGALKDKKGVVVEPIWVWAKGGTYKTLDDYFKYGFKGSDSKTTRILFARNLIR